LPVVVGSLPTTIVFGKLPNTASWQPALPGKKTMAATAAPLVVQSMATTVAPKIGGHNFFAITCQQFAKTGKVERLKFIREVLQIS